MQLLLMLVVPPPLHPASDPGPAGRVVCDVPMNAPRLSELRMSEYSGSDCSGLDQSDCSPTMIVFDDPSLMSTIRFACCHFTRRPSTPPSDTGPLLAVVSVEVCRSDPRMHVYVGS